MTIPDNYIGHNEFLERGIIQQFYPVKDATSAERWVQEDILRYYGSTDYRVHIIRTDESHKHFIHNACIRHNVLCLNHTSTERISKEELSCIFDTPLAKHMVIMVKGLLRRANLIPNAWKMRIGATMEKYVQKYDTNVQVQGLPGRMTGYWKEQIVKGHKTEAFYAVPMGNHVYNTTKANLFLHPRNIQHLQAEPSVVCNNHFKRIPVVISVNPDAAIFTATKKSDKIAFILDNLRNVPMYANLYQFITHPTVKCKQITIPKTEKSYNNFITNVVHACDTRTPYMIGLLKIEQEDKNIWQMFLDNRNHRMCFVISCVDDALYAVEIWLKKLFFLYTR